MDRQTQAREIRKLTAAPDYMLGSVHAITKGATWVVASASSSQLGPYASFPYEDATVRQRFNMGTSLARS